MSTSEKLETAWKFGAKALVDYRKENFADLMQDGSRDDSALCREA
jgi:hypothetical protein